MTTRTPQPRSADAHFEEAHTELRRLAGRYFRGERPDHTLQPTALVHEAYLRLSARSTSWQSRSHFLGIASRVMRQVLVDSARSRKYQKRGGARRRITLQDDLSASPPTAAEILDLDRALSRLGEVDPRKARLVELRVFGGMTVEEAAGELATSKATVDREWRSARAWLARFLSELGEDDRP